MNNEVDQESISRALAGLLAELITVLSEEELIRIRYRLRKAGKSASAILLTHELGLRKRRSAH